MKRVLSLVLALVLVLGMIPTFAADMTAGQHLYEHEFIAGVGNGELNEAGLLTREQLAKLILELNGSKEEAEVLTLPPSFTDSAKISAWARPYVAYAQIEGLMVGFTDGSFRPQEGVTGQQLAQVLTRALGYEFTWATVVADAADLGIDVAVAAKLTRGQAFEAMWATVNLPMKGETLPLGVKLGKLEDTTPKPVGAIAVKSVTAPNGRQVVVEFNQPVKESTIVAANLKVYVGTATTVTTWTANVNGAIVTLGLNADIPQDTDVKVVIKDVVATADEATKMPEATQTVRMKDVTAPSILTVAATTSKTFTFTTSEPLQVAGSEINFHVLQNITVDGLKLVGKISVDYAKNTYTVELGSKLAVGDHVIAVTGLKDIAGFAANTFNGTITIVADTTAPTVTGVTYVDRTTVKVKFSEPVQPAGTFTIDGFATTVGAANSDKTEYTITINNPNKLGLASIIRAVLSYSGTTDMEGNVVATAKTFDFTANDDLVVPTAVVSVDAANKVKVVFSETMSAPGTVVVKNASGTAIPVGTLSLDSSDTTNKTYVSANAIGTGAATYTVELKDSKDNGVRENTIVTTTTSVTTKDIASPTISQVILDTAYAAGPPVVNGKAKIFFSEAMDVATLTNLTNYIVDLDGAGAGLSQQLSAITGAAAVASADGKSVTLTIPGSTFAAGTTRIYVLAVKDAAGNLIATTDFNAVKVVGAAAPALVESGFEITAVNKIKVTFTNALATVDPSNFKVYQDQAGAGANTLAYVGVAYELNAAGNVATITINGNLRTDGKVAATDDTIAKLVIEAGNTKDIYGVAAEQVSVDLVDKVKPTLVSVTQKTTGDPAVNVPNKFVVKFSEVVTAGSLANLATDLIVRYSDGTLVAYTTGYTMSNIVGTPSTDLEITLLPNAKLTDGTNAITVQLAAERYLNDGAAGNFVAPFAATSVNVAVDAVAPVAPTATLNANTIVLAGEVGATIKYLVGGAAATANTVATTGTTYTVALVPADVTDGQHVSIVAIDAVGNVSAVADYVVTEAVAGTITAVTLQ